MAPSPELSYLQRVVMEIMETEHTYVQDLHSIVEGYLAHIIDTADLPIIPEQVCALFGNIEDIYEFNSELLQELNLCRNDPVAIARCFVLKRSYFEIYTQYCTNYPNSVAALTDCMRNKTLLKFFMDRQEALKHQLPLGSYLLKPVQRILKYHLLLQEIAKHFDPDEDGYDVVEEAINTMTEVAWYINTMKRKHEHAVRLQEVQSLLINWRGPDLTTYGELVLEGTFRFHHTKNNRTLFLFEQVLLITKRRGENFIYKIHISCSMLMLMEGEKDSLCFSVTHYKHPKHPHTVQARTMEEKKIWTHHIKRLILENHHTIIPQKAKEVILEMDPMYEKYRFNWSERKKKTQSDDFTHTRQSELTKQMMENNKTMLKDEDWKAHGDTRQSEREDSNTNQMSQSASKFSGFEQEVKSMSDRKLLSDDHVSAVEGSDQYKEKDIALNQDGHSSEEEVEENCAGSQNHSILPSSVLDKAGVIAEHFIANARRGSATPDELQSPHRIPQEITPSKNATANSAPLSPKAEMGSGSERQVGRRRESILSKKEQLLIDKIRNYYENAEEKDAGFSLKRRESLTYIPSGLVRTSVSHFNKIPHTDHQIKPPKSQTSPLTSPAGSEINAKPEDPRHLFSTEADGSMRQRSEECFRSSAEMIKVWQEMEKEVTSSLRENTFRDRSRFRETHSVPQRFGRNTESRNREQLKATEDLSTIREESPVQGKEEKAKDSTENVVWGLEKIFSQNLQGREAVNQPRRHVPETTINTGKSNLALSLTACVQTRQDVDVQPLLGSAVRNVTILSPELSHFLKSPMPVESFFWPDVNKLRSMYTSLECPPLKSLTSGENTLSPGCRTDNRASQIQRAGSLGQKLGGFAWINVQNRNVNGDYCISAQAALPNDRTVTVLEKVQTRAQPKQSPNEVRIQSPASQEKTLMPSVSDRCRLYEDLQEAAFGTKPDSRNKDNKIDKHSKAAQQGVVKNLRGNFF